MKTWQDSNTTACAVEDSPASRCAPPLDCLSAYTVRTKDNDTGETIYGYCKFICVLIRSEQDITNDYLSSLTTPSPSTVFLLVRQSGPVSHDNEESLVSCVLCLLETSFSCTIIA